MVTAPSPPQADRLYLNWSHPRSVAVGDTEVSVHLGGTGSPVLILPGFPESPRAFMPLAERLAHNHYVILPFLPGTGPSHRPVTGGYSIQQTARRMWALCESLGVQSPRVIGHDLGGLAAYWMALTNMRKVPQLVILSTPMRGFGTRWVRQAVRLGFPGIADLLLSLAGPRIVERSYTALAAPGFRIAPEEIEHAVATWAPAGRRAIAASYFRAPRNLLALRTLHNAWLKVPTLLIFGDSAPVMPATSMELTFDAIDKVRAKVIKGAGHFPHLERPQEVVDLVTRFFSQRRKGSRASDRGAPT